MHHSITFDCDGRSLTMPVKTAIAAGFTGRDRAAIDHHIEELRAIGVAPPPSVPILFPLIPTLVTNAEHVCVYLESTTPEIEVAFIRYQGRDYVTVASDQTDRKLEVQSIELSKNVCPKILGRTVWPLEAAADRWDSLRLISTCGDTVLQDGTLSQMLPFQKIFDFVEKTAPGDDREGMVLLSGTIPTKAEPPKEGATVSLRLVDPAENGLGTIRHDYTIKVLRPYF